MAVKPHSIDIVVADMAVALTFYHTLGLNADAALAGEMHVQIETPGGATIGLFAEEIIRRNDPGWTTPVGQRVTFACQCDTPAEVDAVYAKVVAAGFPGVKAPWDSFWGQRYAYLRDPDGNRVDLFAALPEAM